MEIVGQAWSAIWDRQAFLFFEICGMLSQSNIKTQEMLISSGFLYISEFTIGFIICELTSKQSHEGKLKAERNR